MVKKPEKQMHLSRLLSESQPVLSDPGAESKRLFPLNYSSNNVCSYAVVSGGIEGTISAELFSQQIGKEIDYLFVPPIPVMIYVISPVIYPGMDIFTFEDLV